MIYQAYQSRSDALRPLRASAALAAASMRWLPGVWPTGFPGFLPIDNTVAAFELFARTGVTHTRPAFGIDTTTVGNRVVPVVEEVAARTPFATLLHFAKDVDVPQPRMLVIAPLSGHFATLLRNTVEVLLPDNDVYITDWHNARDVPLSEGPFGFDEYVEHVIGFLEAIGPGAHVLAVCQPCVHALAAVAVMAEDDNPAQPRSMTLMAGPVDTRVSPSGVNQLATSKPMEWFERNLIATVPACHRGAGRRVYPGFVQLTAFMSMNAERHLNAHIDLFHRMVAGDTEKVEQVRAFYDEYFAVLDLAAEFYLETVKLVFQDAALAKGTLDWRGRRVDPKAIRRTALLTVEGERDDICSVGQTLAAHDLCSSLRPYRKRHHLQAGVGHYGVFSGRRWAGQIYPLVRNLVLSSD
jgi:polyhydroxyalkanoate depolymerase